MSVHGAQSSLRCPVTKAPIAVQVAEARIQSFSIYNLLDIPFYSL